MSCMLCDCCGNLVDTDDDPDSLYVQKRACLCAGCRIELDEPSEFEDDPPLPAGRYERGHEMSHIDNYNSDAQADHLRGVIRAIELNVDGLNTKGFKHKPETQQALDRIKALCREALK